MTNDSSSRPLPSTSVEMFTEDAALMQEVAASLSARGVAVVYSEWHHLGGR